MGIKNSNWGGCSGDAGKACLNVDLEPKVGPGCGAVLVNQKPPVPPRGRPGSRQTAPEVPRNLEIPRMRRTPGREAISAHNCAARLGGRLICVTIGCVPLLEMWRAPRRGPHFRYNAEPPFTKVEKFLQKKWTKIPNEIST